MNVFVVFKGDAWLSSRSLELMGVFGTLEESVDAIVSKGRFEKDWIEEQGDYAMDEVKEFLLEQKQTPQCGDVNYIIDERELNNWED